MWESFLLIPAGDHAVKHDTGHQNVASGHKVILTSMISSRAILPQQVLMRLCAEDAEFSQPSINTSAWESPTDALLLVKSLYHLHMATYLSILLRSGQRLRNHLLHSLGKPLEHPASQKLLLNSSYTLGSVQPPFSSLVGVACRLSHSRPITTKGPQRKKRIHPISVSTLHALF